MMETLSVLALFGSTFAFIALGLHFGFKWIDKMLRYQPIDPSKPIVRRLPTPGLSPSILCDQGRPPLSHPNRHRERDVKMREYVDGIQGEGAWDRMHDLIDRKELFGWTMPPVEVDGKTVSIFPGTNREVTLEAIQDSLREAFAQHPTLPPLLTE